MARFGSGAIDKRDSLMTHYNEVQGTSSATTDEYISGKLGSGPGGKKVKTNITGGGSDNYSSVGRDDRMRVKLRPSDVKAGPITKKVVLNKPTKRPVEGTFSSSFDLRQSGNKIPTVVANSSMSGYERMGSAMETTQQQSANSKTKSTSVPE